MHGEVHGSMEYGQQTVHQQDTAGAGEECQQWWLVLISTWWVDVARLGPTLEERACYEDEGMSIWTVLLLFERLESSMLKKLIWRMFIARRGSLSRLFLSWRKKCTICTTTRDLSGLGPGRKYHLVAPLHFYPLSEAFRIEVPLASYHCCALWRAQFFDKGFGMFSLLTHPSNLPKRSQVS